MIPVEGQCKKERRTQAEALESTPTTTGLPASQVTRNNKNQATYSSEPDSCSSHLPLVASYCKYFNEQAALSPRCCHVGWWLCSQHCASTHSSDCVLTLLALLLFRTNPKTTSVPATPSGTHTIILANTLNLSNNQELTKVFAFENIKGWLNGTSHVV